jgi:hypothetical protein
VCGNIRNHGIHFRSETKRYDINFTRKQEEACGHKEEMKKEKERNSEKTNMQINKIKKK